MDALLLSALKTLFDNTSDIMFIKDTDLRYVAVSPSFIQVMNVRDAGAVIGCTDADIFPNDPEIARRYMDDDRMILSTGCDKIGYVEPLPGEGGAGRFCSTSKYAIHDETGRAIGLYGTSRDITYELRLSKENDRLRWEDIHLKSALSSTTVSVWEYDVSGDTLYRIDSSTPKAVASGLPDGLLRTGLVHPDSRADLVRALDSLRLGDLEGDLVLKTPGDDDCACRYQHVHFRTLFAGDNTPYKALIVSEDISDMQRARMSYEQEIGYRLAMTPGIYSSGLLDLSADRVLQCSIVPPLPMLQEDWRGMTVGEFSSKLHSLLVIDSSPNLAGAGVDSAFLIKMFESHRHTSPTEFLCRTTSGTRWCKDRSDFMIDPSNGHLMMTFSIIDIEEQKRTEYQLRMAAERDAMTGLLNHDFTIRKAAAALVEEPEALHALFCIDIDRFKNVNDTFGHLRGDEVIINLSHIIRDSFRSTDIVGRVGGDEFLVLMKNVPDADIVKRKAGDLVRALEYRCTVDGTSVDISASVGVAICRGGDMTYEQLFSRADSALYDAKRAGRDGFVLSFDGE